MRRAVYGLAIGLIALWTGYCLLDLVYVTLGYWSLTPEIGLLPIFTSPAVEPGFWGDYLKRLTASWGSVVTAAGVIALLVRQPVQLRERLPDDGPVATYPVIPEAERTEPRLLFIEEPAAPRQPTERERDTLRGPEAPGPGGLEEPAARPRIVRSAPTYPEARLEQAGAPEGDGAPRRHPMRTSPIVRALRGRATAAPQPRSVEPSEAEDAGAEPRLFAGGAREEFAFFEVEYDDGTATVERLRRADYGGDDAAGIALLRRRLAERAASERRPMQPIAAITPVSYFGFPNR